jgi:two-component system NtrC family response regulator
VTDGLAACQSQYCDLVLLDLELPDGNGLSILPDLVKSPWSPEVIIITGTGNIQGAEIAFKYGAWDFIPKPISPGEVKLSLSRALQYRDEKLATQKPLLFSREGIVGEAPAMEACLERVAQAANTESTVLVTGETGAGKELIARAVHKNSKRAQGSFVVVDCASLPSSLIESALFGYEKGAFTGAVTSRPGMIKQADQGTLFLDEVGELPPSMQKTFLRVLQEHCFRPVGGETEVQSDFRLVAATNRDLDAMVNAGKFRSDLLYRLRSLVIHVPPLRERRTDIISLVTKHLEKKSAATHTALKGCSPEFIQLLQAYDWPGNVRELLNALDHALVSAGNTTILHPVHLPHHIRLPQIEDKLRVDEADPHIPSEHSLQKEMLPLIRDYTNAILESAEEAYLVELMRRTQGRIKIACKMSGLSESRLHALLKKYNTPRFR